MKLISETHALDKLAKIKADLKFSTSNYERRAKSCLTCETPGVCCLDAHFVNVHISRLEAVAIRNVLNDLPADVRGRVSRRIDETIAKYALTAKGSTSERTY